MEKKIKSESIYEGNIIHVFKDEVLVEENNCNAFREIVRHNGGVGIIAVNDENKILLVKQFRYAINDFTIEIPAGKLELNEEPLECAKREIEEETGYTTKEINKVLEIIPTPGYCDEILHLFYAKTLQRVENPLPKDEDEFIEIIYLDLDEAYQQVKDGIIIDAKTVVGIMYAKLER